MKVGAAALACLCVLGLLGSAHARTKHPAQDNDGVGPRNALSLHPFSLAAHGLALQYERYVLPRRWSLALGLGFRSSSREDYSSWVTSVGIEPRYWLQTPARSRELGRDAMVGAFASVRFDAAWMGMTNTRRDEWVGGNVGLSFVGSFGWRFALKRFELTPSAGLGTRTDFDSSGRLAPWTRYVARLGWTVGYLF